MNQAIANHLCLNLVRRFLLSHYIQDPKLVETKHLWSSTFFSWLVIFSFNQPKGLVFQKVFGTDWNHSLQAHSESARTIFSIQYMFCVIFINHRPKENNVSGAIPSHIFHIPSVLKRTLVITFNPKMYKTTENNSFFSNDPDAYTSLSTLTINFFQNVLLRGQ